MLYVVVAGDVFPRLLAIPDKPKLEVDLNFVGNLSSGWLHWISFTHRLEKQSESWSLNHPPCAFGGFEMTQTKSSFVMLKEGMSLIDYSP